MAAPYSQFTLRAVKPSLSRIEYDAEKQSFGWSAKGGKGWQCLTTRPRRRGAVIMADDDKRETEGQRTATNIGIAVFLAALVGGGIWLANAIVDLRKTQDCVLSGRRNCAPIATPGRETW